MSITSFIGSKKKDKEFCARKFEATFILSCYNFTSLNRIIYHIPNIKVSFSHLDAQPHFLPHNLLLYLQYCPFFSQNF